jgi:hypothetical protein
MRRRVPRPLSRGPRIHSDPWGPRLIGAGVGYPFSPCSASGSQPSATRSVVTSGVTSKLTIISPCRRRSWDRRMRNAAGESECGQVASVSSQSSVRSPTALPHSRSCGPFTIAWLGMYSKTVRIGSSQLSQLCGLWGTHFVNFAETLRIGEPGELRRSIYAPVREASGMGNKIPREDKNSKVAPG